MSNATKNSCAEFEAAKEVIDTTYTSFLTDVEKVYNKVQQLERLCKLDITSFNNKLTVSTGIGVSLLVHVFTRTLLSGQQLQKLSSSTRMVVHSVCSNTPHHPRRKSSTRVFQR